MKLDAKTASERRIAAWLEENASEALRVKIEAAGASMDGVMKHITSEARKQERNGCACVADEEVFGWAVHYYEELGKRTEEEGERTEDGGRRTEDGEQRTEDKSCFAPAEDTEDKAGPSTSSGQADFEGLDLFGGEA